MSMERSDWMLLGMTFLTGVFIGVALYVLSFKPTYTPETLNESESVAQSFSIIGEQYGGFQEAGYRAPSFRLLADGSYTYAPGGTDASIPVTGVLPNSLFVEIEAVSNVAELQENSLSIEPDSCRSFSDGIEYRYQVVRDGEVFVLDSCTTTLGYDSELALVLEDVWWYLNDPASFATEPPRSVSDRLGDWLYQRLHGDTVK
jgi:hypothetical protein